MTRERNSSGAKREEDVDRTYLYLLRFLSSTSSTNAWGVETLSDFGPLFLLQTPVSPHQSSGVSHFFGHRGGPGVTTKGTEGPVRTCPVRWYRSLVVWVRPFGVRELGFHPWRVSSPVRYEEGV